MTDPLPPEMAAALAASAGRRGGLGDVVHYYDEIGSTNDVAAQLAEHGAAHGTLVLAGRQTAGRGRMGRPWFSPPGAGLYASLVLRSAAVAPVVTLACGVAVARGVTAATGLPVEIKWPNDIVVPDDTAGRRQWRKLAGILAEASLGGGGVADLMLGFGVNLAAAAYPPEVAGQATSLESELGRPVDGGAVLAAVLVALAVAIGQIETGRVGEVLDAWRAAAPGLPGRSVAFEAGGGRRRGTVSGIDSDGALLVRTEAGVERVISGEVIWT